MVVVKTCQSIHHAEVKIERTIPTPCQHHIPSGIRLERTPLFIFHLPRSCPSHHCGLTLEPGPVRRMDEAPTRRSSQLLTSARPWHFGLPILCRLIFHLFNLLSEATNVDGQPFSAPGVAGQSTGPTLERLV